MKVGGIAPGKGTYRQEGPTQAPVGQCVANALGHHLSSEPVSHIPWARTGMRKAPSPELLKANELLFSIYENFLFFSSRIEMQISSRN